MSIAEHRHAGYASAGLFIGAFGWALSTILGPAYADQTCAMRTMISGGLAIAGLVLVAIGALLSWHSNRLLQATDVSPAIPARNARVFLAHISIMICGIFALALLFQVAAAFVFNGCER